MPRGKVTIATLAGAAAIAAAAIVAGALAVDGVLASASGGASAQGQPATPAATGPATPPEAGLSAYGVHGRPAQGQLPEVDESDPDLGPIHAHIRATHRLEDVADATAASEVVAVGTVTGVSEGHDNGWFRFRAVHVAVEETYAGAHRDELAVQQIAVDARTGRPIVVEGQLTPDVGDRVLVFAHPSDAAGAALIAVNHVTVFDVGRDGFVTVSGRSSPFVRRVEGQHLAALRRQVRAARRP